MLAALPGHGMDRDGVWSDGPVGFGCRHRAITEEDLAERLPRLDTTTGLAITANARIDGRGELCDALGIPSADRPDLPDSALILAAFVRWGQECPRHLLGDFAFAVWDTKSRELFCARDHVGARPFYYCLTAERFVFASVVNAVLAAPGVSRELDEAAIATRLSPAGGRRPLGSRTFFRMVRRLAPGHTLTLNENGRAQIERWWRPEEVRCAPPASDDSCAEAFLGVYREVVKDCVRSIHPVGVHLSGGLDSSSVAVLAARELRRQGRAAPPAFSWHPPPGERPHSAAEESEYGAIESVCKQEGLRPFYPFPSPAEIVDHLRRDAADATGEVSLVHELSVQRAAAAQGVRVLLSGYGGDEGISFNGRGYYSQLLMSGRLGRLWRDARRRSRRPIGYLLLHAALPLVVPAAAHFVRDLRGGWRRSRMSFIHPSFVRRTRPLSAPASMPMAQRPLQRALLQSEFFSRRIEAWAASGAQHGIEYRYPLLDRRVLQLALSLAPEQFLRDGCSRWFMRRALGTVLPARICWNEKDADPVRVEALRENFAEALSAVRSILDTASAPPARCAYFNLPRLVTRLDADRFRADPRFGPIANALLLLDF